MPVPPIARVRRRCLIGAAAIMATLIVPVSAQAGRLVVTGHDAESHCVEDAVGKPNAGSCAFVATTVNWVRGGATNKDLPVLILDRGALDFEKSVAQMTANGTPTPYQVVDPRSPEFASLPLNPNTYSAILIASSKDDPADPTPQDLNEFGSTPDTDAINARAADIATFFNAGGGIAVMSGGAAARADSAKYYAFLKITRGGAAVTHPFTLEPIGRTIGFQDAFATPGDIDMINCCETHVSFDLPAPESPLRVAEHDKADRAVTLIANTSDLSRIEEPRTDGETVFAGLPGVPSGGSGGDTGNQPGPSTGSTKSKCVPKSSLKISLKRPKGVRFSKLVVYVNGKKTRTISGKTLGVKAKTKAFTLKLSKTKTSKIRLVVTTAAGHHLTYNQTFKPCG